MLEIMSSIYIGKMYIHHTLIFEAILFVYGLLNTEYQKDNSRKRVLLVNRITGQGLTHKITIPEGSVFKLDKAEGNLDYIKGNSKCVIHVC